jgi:predicted DNA-binding transcriptional regulator AlpA
MEMSFSFAQWLPCAKVSRLVETGVCNSRMGLHRLRRDDPNFPKPIKLGGGIVWFEDEIAQWLEARRRIEKCRVPPAAGSRAAAGRHQT